VKTIIKFPIEAEDEQVINIPLGHRILSVQEQFDRGCIWALVDTDETPLPVRIITVGAGNSADAVWNVHGAIYVGNYKLRSGWGGVLHVWVVR
jgi:hypothetical protein